MTRHFVLTWPRQSSQSRGRPKRRHRKSNESNTRRPAASITWTLTFGGKVADPYRWLEADVRHDKAVADWVAAEKG